MPEAPRQRGLAHALVLFAVVVAALLGFRPPAVRPADAPPEAFSAARARPHLEALTRAPRPVGSPAHDEARHFIEGELRALGVEVEVQEATSAVYQAGHHAAARVANVVGFLRGTGSPGNALLLAAHYDTVPGSPGAADDGAGVAVLLECARALAHPRPQRDVVLLFSDGEELGLLGAHAFVEGHPRARNLYAAINVEARGSSGVSVMWKSSRGNAALVRVLDRALARPVSSSLVATLGAALPNDTDGTVFDKAGVPSFDFAFAQGVHDYHQRTDSLATLDLPSVQHQGDDALALVRALTGPGAPATLASPEAVAYFDLFSLDLVAMPLRGVQWLAGLALVVWAAWVFRSLLGRRVRGGRLLGASAAWLAAMIVGVGVAVAASALVRASLRPQAQGVVAPFLAVASVAIVGATLFGALALLRRAFCAEALAAGAVLLPLASGAVLAGFVPEAGYVLVVPAFAAAAALWLRWPPGLRREPPGAQAVVLLSLEAPATYFAAATTVAFYVLQGEAMPWLCAVTAGWLGLLLVPAVAANSPRASAVAAGAQAALATALVLYTFLLPRPAEGNDLAYAVDLDRGAALWRSTHGAEDGFPRAMLGASPRVEPLPAFTPFSDAVWFASAPAAAVPRPSAQVERLGPQRWRVAVTAPAARCVQFFSDDPHLRFVDVDGRPWKVVSRFSPEKDAELLRAVLGLRPRAAVRGEICGGLDAPFTLGVASTDGRATELAIVSVLDGFALAPNIARGPDAFAAQGSDVTLVALRIPLAR